MDPAFRSARIKAIGLWGLTGILSALFLLAGGLKLRGTPSSVENFSHWGYPEWFVYTVGGIELAGAIGLLFPQSAAAASILLAVMMLGASLTHLVHHEMMAVPIPLVILGLLVVVGRARRGPLLEWYERVFDS